MSAVPPAPPPAVVLNVDASGFRDASGEALVAVYDASDAWLKLDRARAVQRLKIIDGRIHAVFEGLKPGIYAVSVIHDANVNGKLDMRWFPIPGPTEGAGVSRDASATFGPPAYDDAIFRLGPRGGVIQVKVRY